ncbi:LamG domain-containing protein [Phragmitibacter flavus]|uniref:LamG domain-containing protein n=1 Tax=Phragmitibacter flavus TaxID=2576071 RepID=A0A5R8KB67_9BACT|nr:LamG domain-containing protein [Phragmitibacter flavus]TLD69546.1 LamG domain-containing protein [Phragmitibacter flavus]
MKLVSQSVLLATALCCSPASAVVTLESADSFWKFDGGTVSTAATFTQVVDSSVNNHQVTSGNFANLSWVAGPANGPYGGAPQYPGGHAIKFSPTVTTQVTGTGADTVSSATFIATNASVSGSSTMITRMRWDGAIPLAAGGGFIDDGTNQWIVSNGFGGWSEPSLASFGYMFGLNTNGSLYYYTAGAGAGQTSSGASHVYNPAAILNVGEWYDIAMVLNDNGDADKKTGQVTFYLVGANGILSTFTSNATTWVSPTSNGNLLLGSETPGTGSGNHRKAFNGAMDYLALFDTALTQQEVLAIFAAPEPSRAVLLLSGLCSLALRRRRGR